MTFHTRAAPALVLLVVAALSGCGSDSGRTASDPSSTPDELAEHDGQPCPDQLPVAANHGFGTDDSAQSAPTLPAADEGWVCRYQPRDGETTPSGGTIVEWTRDGDARPVDDLAELEGAVAALEPPSGERMCTQELGPRWLLVLSEAGDLTGVLVDGFGCRDVRLTDDPYATVAGESSEHGLVPGVLVGPESLLEDLQAAYSAS